MEKKVLIEYCDMKAEIKEIKRLIAKTEYRLESIAEEGDVSDVVKGGYGGTQHFKVTGEPVPELKRVKALLEKRKKRLEKKEKELLDMTNEVEEYIDSIEKSEYRIMFRLYYIEGLTWAAVAMRMNALFPKRTYTEDGCRMKNSRFFEKN